MVPESSKQRIVELARQITQEQDSVRFTELVERLNELLDEYYSQSESGGRSSK